MASKAVALSFLNGQQAGDTGCRTCSYVSAACLCAVQMMYHEPSKAQATKARCAAGKCDLAWLLQHPGCVSWHILKDRGCSLTRESRPSRQATLSEQIQACTAWPQGIYQGEHSTFVPLEGMDWVGAQHQLYRISTGGIAPACADAVEHSSLCSPPPRATAGRGPFKVALRSTVVYLKQVVGIATRQPSDS